VRRPRPSSVLRPCARRKKRSVLASLRNPCPVSRRCALSSTSSIFFPLSCVLFFGLSRGNNIWNLEAEVEEKPFVGGSAT
jgi:hypothetical protein